MPLTIPPHDKYTTIYHKEPLQLSESNHPLLILIPGNPGLVDFYFTYLNLIQMKYPTIEVLCISHAGFKSDIIEEDDIAFKFFDLEFQVQHKIDIIKYFILKENKPRDLYFLSHSVGSYITQRVVHGLIYDLEIQNFINIKFLGLICPTIIDIGQSNSGQLINKLFSLLPLVQIAVVFSTLLNFILPERVIKAVIRNFVIDKPSSSNDEELQSLEHSRIGAFKIFQTKNIIQQALHMANDEMKTILKDNDFNDWFFNDLLSKNNVTIWTYFAYSDHWVHDSTRDYILTRYHNSKNKRLVFQVGDVEDSITHSFCVNKSVEFAEITCGRLSEFF